MILNYLAYYHVPICHQNLRVFEHLFFCLLLVELQQFLLLQAEVEYAEIYQNVGSPELAVIFLSN
jgi:hypothetical protein